MIAIAKLKISPLPYKDERIVAAFNANQLVSGPHINLFENELSDIFKFKFAHTTSSGFSALFLALKTLNLEKAKVVVPAVSTCHAMTNAVLANGFEVVFCEIDPNHLSLSLTSLADIFRSTKIDAIIAPSHFGIPAPIEVYKQFGALVIEDACQAFFTRTSISSSADIMVLSFYPTKQFNCIEGGALLYNSLETKNIIEDLRYYDHQAEFDGRARYNLRMPNLHAAFGCILIDSIENERNRLIKLKETYAEEMISKEFLLPAFLEHNVIPWRFLIKLKHPKLLKSFFDVGIQSDIELMSLTSKNYTVSWFRQLRSIPYYSNLSELEQKIVIEAINSSYTNE